MDRERSGNHIVDERRFAEASVSNREVSQARGGGAAGREGIEVAVGSSDGSHSFGVQSKLHDSGAGGEITEPPLSQSVPTPWHFWAATPRTQALPGDRTGGAAWWVEAGFLGAQQHSDSPVAGGSGAGGGATSCSRAQADFSSGVKQQQVLL